MILNKLSGCKKPKGTHFHLSVEMFYCCEEIMFPPTHAFFLFASTDFNVFNLLFTFLMALFCLIKLTFKSFLIRQHSLVRQHLRILPLLQL